MEGRLLDGLFSSHSMGGPWKSLDCAVGGPAESVSVCGGAGVDCAASAQRPGTPRPSGSGQACPRDAGFTPPSGGGVSSPSAEPALYNPVYDALTSRGLVVPMHSGLVGSSIASDNFYDQVALFPATSKKWFVQMGVFDFDKVVFPDLWARGNRQAFNAYLRYYLSDHRPMWVEVRVG